MSKVVELKKYRRQVIRRKRATRITEFYRVSIAGSWTDEVVRRFWRPILFTSAAFAIAVHLNSAHEPRGTSIAAALVLVGVAWSCYTIGLPIVGSIEQDDYEDTEPPSAA
jgi:hypothetical protein